MAAVLDDFPHPTRRGFLAAAGSFVAWAHMPGFARAAGSRDPRLLVVILRGAMDGLAVVPPVGDPDHVALRGDLALGAADPASVLALDGFFALNPAMPKLHARYRAGEATIVHAAATPYRERSHFDGQDVLENGTPGPRGAGDGWLNRVVANLPRGERVRPAGGLAVSPTVPLILRGAAPTFTWTPPDLRPASSDTAQRLLALYGHTDPVLSQVFANGLEVEALAAQNRVDAAGGGMAGAFRRVAAGAGRLLARDDGPRVAALSYDGWDTHANEGAAGGRLSNLLGALDGALDALAVELAPVWRQTVVAVVTEFGRTARINGTEGTDHGTATTAFVLGGAVRGGRVVADWPGLKAENLFQNRDLAPTTDLRAVLKGVLRDHLALSERTLGTAVFPGSLPVRPLDGLVVA